MRPESEDDDSKDQNPPSPPRKPNPITLQVITEAANLPSNTNNLANELSKVSRLDLSWRNLGPVVDNLLPVNNVRELLLQHNAIRSISSGIDFLFSLQFLSVAHNEIETLIGLSSLTKLEYLDASYNKISSVDASHLPSSLQILELHHNPCADKSNRREYREAIVTASHLGKLRTLDGHAISRGERAGLLSWGGGRNETEYDGPLDDIPLSTRVNMIFNHFDKDCDGFLNYEEGNELTVTTEGIKRLSVDDWIQLCRFFNADSSMGITAADLKELYTDPKFDSNLDRDFALIFKGKENGGTKEESNSDRGRAEEANANKESVMQESKEKARVQVEELFEKSTRTLKDAWERAEQRKNTFLRNRINEVEKLRESEMQLENERQEAVAAKIEEVKSQAEAFIAAGRERAKSKRKELMLLTRTDNVEKMMEERRLKQ